MIRETYEVEEPVLEHYETPETIIECVDGRYVEHVVMMTHTRQVIDEHPLTDAEGAPLLDAAGNPRLHRVPRMQKVTRERDVPVTEFGNRLPNSGNSGNSVSAPTVIETREEIDPVKLRRAVIALVEEMHEATTYEPGADAALFPILAKRAAAINGTLSEARAQILDEIAAAKQ